MSEPKFKFGDYVYHAALESVEVPVECQDCAGNRYVTIIYNGETFTIDCEGCKRGYQSWGTVPRHEYRPIVLEGNVDAVEKGWSAPYEIEYRIAADSGGRWCLKEEDTFATKEAALARAQVLRAEHDAREAARIVSKVKPDRSWAWNIHYHQKRIRDARNTIEEATLQLNAARKYAKESPQ